MCSARDIYCVHPACASGVARFACSVLPAPLPMCTVLVARVPFVVLQAAYAEVAEGIQ